MSNNRFLLLRQFVFSKIAEALKEDGACKSYEGAMRITENWPDYFEDSDGKHLTYTVELDCYVYGPSRHYEWRADTLDEVVNKADKEIRSWSVRQGEQEGTK